MTYVDGQGFTEIVESDGKGRIKNVNDTPTGQPVITGEWNIGSTLTAETSQIYDEDGVPVYTDLYDPFSYQWMKKLPASNTWQNITKNSNQKNYKITTDDDGYQIKVKVSFTDLHNTEESIDSLSKLFKHTNYKPTGAVTINGNAEEGVTLNVTNNLADEDGITGSIAFEWREVLIVMKEWDLLGMEVLTLE